MDLVITDHTISFVRGDSIKPILSICLLHDGKNQDSLQGIEVRIDFTYSNSISFELAVNAKIIV